MDVKHCIDRIWSDCFDASCSFTAEQLTIISSAITQAKLCAEKKVEKKPDIEIEINSTLVKSCYIEEYRSGIISVLFDTKKRWIDFGRGNDQTYWFRDNDADVYDYVSIPPFLPDKSYMKYSNQEKDQVEWLYIPMDLLE